MKSYWIMPVTTITGIALNKSHIGLITNKFAVKPHKFFKFEITHSFNFRGLPPFSPSSTAHTAGPTLGLAGCACVGCSRSGARAPCPSTRSLRRASEWSH
jgi:hypothetical protein